MLLLGKLPVRISDDLRVDADPGATLTPMQGLALAEHLTGLAIRRQVLNGLRVQDILPGRKVTA